MPDAPPTAREPVQPGGFPGRFRSVVPDMPPLESVAVYLREAYAAEWFSNFGPLSRRLETELAGAYGAPGETCVCASSATAALSAALLSWPRPGPVLLPAFTFPASLAAIRAAGREPVVVDVSATTWALDPQAVEDALARTDAAAVMAVSPFGIHDDVGELLALCGRREAALVVDSAAGLGAGRPRGAARQGAFEIYSMHATKPFCIGEGGVVFSHPDHEESLRAALNFSLLAPARRELPAWGFNGKLSELHAAVGLAQIRRFSMLLAGRHAFAARYAELLGPVRGVKAPASVEAAPWQVFPVLASSVAAADRMVASAASAGLEVRRYYRPSLTDWPGVRTLGACPIAADLAGRMCCLPIRSRIGPEADEILGIVAWTAKAALVEAN